MASIDAFGSPISLTFRGNSSFTTSCGGLTTILVYALSTWLTIALFVEMLDFQNPMIQTYVEAEKPEGTSNLFEQKQIFSVKLSGFPTYTLDPRFGVLEFGWKQTRPNQKVDGTSRSIIQSDPSERTPLKLCDIETIQGALNFVDTDHLPVMTHSYCLP